MVVANLLSLKYSCRETRCLGSKSLKFVALSLVAKAYVRCREAKILSRAQLWIWGFVYFINGVKFQRNNAYHRFKILVFVFDLRFRIKILIFPICQLYFFGFCTEINAVIWTGTTGYVRPDYRKNRFLKK